MVEGASDAFEVEVKTVQVRALAEDLAVAVAAVLANEGHVVSGKACVAAVADVQPDAVGQGTREVHGVMLEEGLEAAVVCD